MKNRPLWPWYGTANMETDEPIVTHCGKTVDPRPPTEPDPLDVARKIILDNTDFPEGNGTDGTDRTD